MYHLNSTRLHTLLYNVLNLNFAIHFLKKPHTGLASDHHHHHHQHPTSLCHCDLQYTSEQQRREEQHLLQTRQLTIFTKRKETQRCGKSRMFPDHPCRATPTKVVMRGGVPDVVNHTSKLVRHLDSLRCQNLPFFYA